MPVRELSAAQRQRVGKGWNSTIRRGQHRKTWFIGERQFIGIYTFNCRDLRQPRLISHARLLQRRKNIGCRGKQERSKHRVRTRATRSLFSFFLQRSICYCSRFGGNRTPINRPKIFGPVGRIHGRRVVFSQIRRKPRGQPQRRAVIVVEIRSIGAACDYEIRSRRRRRRGEKRRGEKRAVRGYEIAEGNAIGRRKWVCSLHPVYCSRWENVVARTALRFSVQRTIVALYPRE